MSFRGGRGGGRGGLGSASRLNSGAVPFDIDEELQAAFDKIQNDKDSLFPSSDEQELNLYQEYMPHLAAPVTAKEKERIKHTLDLQDSLKNGWLSKAIDKLQAKTAERNGNIADFNPFEDVPQYGKKRTAEKVPKFSEFPFVKEHFPKELWDVIDPMNEGANPDARKTKKLKLATKPTRDKLADFDDADEPEEAAAEVENEEKNPDDDFEEELQDDEFEEDENDDMADDYNAERYFSGGDEDYDEYAGGDDGGGDDGY